ncbi:MAG TPA: energy transducer TonB [Longimicrobiaceae bacterium]|nr:energy transducer TonB [Longimicrobiaceae bacterium]
MRSTILPFGALLCGLALTPGAAMAQAAPTAPLIGAYPSCAAEGISRVAFTIPPGQTQAQVESTLRQTGAFPAGTEMTFFPYGGVPPLRNQEEMNRSFGRTVRRLLHEGFRIDGTVSVLLQVNADGTVEKVTPNSGNRGVDSQLRALWSKAQLEPLVIGGCRVAAWLQVPIAFTSDWDIEARRIKARAGEPPR